MQDRRAVTTPKETFITEKSAELSEFRILWSIPMKAAIAANASQIIVPCLKLYVKPFRKPAQT